MSDELPQGWAATKLDQLVSLVIGGDWGKDPGELTNNGFVRVRVIRGTDFKSWGDKKGTSAAERSIKASSLDRRRLKDGDIVLEVSGGGPNQPVGRTVLIDDDTLKTADGPLVCSNFFRLLRLHSEVDPRFVNYFLNYAYAKGAFNEFQTETTNLRNLNVPDFLELTEVWVAPVAEQRRIVMTLEIVFRKVDACQKRLANIPDVLKRFRQSVLAAACSGRLTANWREQTETAVDSSGLGEAPDGYPPLPETWRWGSLETVCKKIVDCPHSTPKWTDSGHLCVRTTNFKPGFLDLSEVRYVSNETFKQRIERLHPQPGDILYSREGGILGIACIIPPGVELCLGQRMMLLRTGTDFTGALLMHWLNSPLILSRVQQLTGGTASPHLNVRDIKDFPTPMPPLAEQHEIVSRVEALLALADQIEARLGKAQAQVDKLTPSLFARTFSGQLVPTEAQLAHQERREYEPASVLVERLQRERKAGRSATKEEHAVSKTKRRVTPQRTRVMSVRRRGLVRKESAKKPPQTAR